MGFLRINSSCYKSVERKGCTKHSCQRSKTHAFHVLTWHSICHKWNYISWTSSFTREKNNKKMSVRPFNSKSVYHNSGKITFQILPSAHHYKNSNSVSSLEAAQMICHTSTYTESNFTKRVCLTLINLTPGFWMISPAGR